MRWHDPTEEKLAGWRAWVAERPASIREIIEARGFDPWKLYEIASTGSIVSLESFSEDGTVKVYVGPEFNLDNLFSRDVFGYRPEDLLDTPNAPSKGEPVLLCNCSETAGDLWNVGASIDFSSARYHYIGLKGTGPLNIGGEWVRASWAVWCKDCYERDGMLASLNGQGRWGVDLAQGVELEDVSHLLAGRVRLKAEAEAIASALVTPTIFGPVDEDGVSRGNRLFPSDDES